MTKRKPQKVVVHRIELQTKERELIEQYMYMQQGNKLIQSITQLKLPELYGILNLLELFGLIDTPIPTISDVDEIPSAIRSWVETTRINPETGEKETVLLQDRIINFLAPLFSVDAWLGRENPYYGTPAYGSPTKGYSASGMTQEEVRQANTTEALGEDFIGPTYPSD
jgi:hypothetical protein